MKSVAPNIGDYGIIGDCKSAALISRDGALDWLCWPRFDSPSIFAGILDLERGGRWIISPDVDCPSTRRYLPETNVLETRFKNSTGTATLTDFMPLAEKSHVDRHLTPDQAIVRLLRCDAGTMKFSISFSPRPNFARGETRIMDRGKLGLRVPTPHGMLALHSRVRFEIDGGNAVATLRLNAGDEFPFILTYSESAPEVIPLLGDAGNSLTRTAEWWRKWASNNCYAGPYREAVTRSALTLKLLEFPTSGAFVAAPTTSLPERIGGNLNWDYRYCWLRDASFVIEALCGTNFVVEADAFAGWLLHATRSTQPKLMVLYDVYGNLAPRETALTHLAGHRGSSPVNIGNGARTQSQLDIYGHVISGAATLLKKKREPADQETARVLIKLGQHVCDHWCDADDGIWEVRGKPAIHTHARLACWLALEELIGLHERKLIAGVPLDKFSHTRDTIRQSIETESWDESLSTYTAEPGRPEVDASLLCLSIAGFTDASSQRMQSTYRRLCDRLDAGNSLLYRNLPPDGIPVEGAFGICGFWRVQFLAMGGGSLADAEAAFESLATTANDLGLLGEETDPATGAVLGNFPQAFTHVGLINAALAIEERRKSEDQS